MVSVTQVSGRTRGETRKDVARNITRWFRFFSGQHVMKDPGQVGEHLADRGYNVKIVCYGGSADCEIPRNAGKAHVVALEYSWRVFRVLRIPFFLCHNWQSAK